VTRKEARALTEAVRSWRHLLVQPTTVWTDHQALERWARGGCEQDAPCLVRWGLWLQGQPLTVRWCPGADNGVADHASRVGAQLWYDFTPLMDDTIHDRRARRYKKVGNVLYYGQKRVPELEGAKRKGWLIKTHLELGHATKTALQDMLRRENIDWEAMEAEIEEVVAACDDFQRAESAPAPAKANKVGRRADWRVEDEWSVDLIVDLPTTSEGNRHCIVFTEAVSGSVEVYPLPDREALRTMGCAQDLFWVTIELRASWGSPVRSRRHFR